MFGLQYIPGSSVAILSVGLLLGGWAQPESAGAEQSYPADADVAKALSNPRDAAMVDFIARRLPCARLAPRGAISSREA